MQTRHAKNPLHDPRLKSVDSSVQDIQDLAEFVSQMDLILSLESLLSKQDEFAI